MSDLPFSVVDLVNAAPQYVALTMFVAYTLWRDKGWREHLKDQDSRWLNFLIDEREQRKVIMEQSYSRFSSDMNRVASAVADLTVAISAHDRDAQVRHERIIRAVDKINGKD